MDAASNLSIDWSPVSRILTYTRLEPGGSGHAVYAVDVQTGNETTIAPAPSGSDYWWPTFSPDDPSSRPAGPRVARPPSTSCRLMDTGPSSGLPSR